MPVSRTCTFCGAPFTCVPSKPQKYCSRSCEYANRRKPKKPRLQFTCKQCGKPFGQRYWKKNSQYCSLQCAGQAQQKRTTRTCVICNTIFVVEQRRKNSAKYCSNECRYKGLIKDQDHFVCAWCGEEYSHHKSRNNRGYCSQHCYNMTRSHGRGPQPPKMDYGPHWHKIRTQVLRRDNFVCQKCGAYKRLHVHHIIPWRVSYDNSLTNLVTLCPTCHVQVETQYRRSEKGLAMTIQHSLPLD